jgi:nucleotide-binding universal stress UspA family protein
MAMPKLERILVPVDFSICSGVALRYAAFLAEPFQVPIDVLHVIRAPPASPGAQVMVDVSGKHRQSFREFARARAEKEMRNFLETVSTPETITLEVRYELGEPWRIILQVAEELASDLIVIGTRGRTGLKHLIMGSVAEKVVRRGPCAVLAVREQSPTTPEPTRS